MGFASKARRGGREPCFENRSTSAGWARAHRTEFHERTVRGNDPDWIRAFHAPKLFESLRLKDFLGPGPEPSIGMSRRGPTSSALSQGWSYPLWPCPNVPLA